MCRKGELHDGPVQLLLFRFITLDSPPVVENSIVELIVVVAFSSKVSLFPFRVSVRVPPEAKVVLDYGQLFHHPAAVVCGPLPFL